MNETLTKGQFAILSIFLSTSLFLGATVYGVIHIAYQDAWLSMIISYLVGFIPLFIYYKLLNHNPKYNIIELLNNKFKNFGKIISGIFIVFMIIHTSLMLWNTSNFINSQYLYQTPILMISILFMIGIIYIVETGITGIGKTGIIIAIMSTVLAIITTIALTPEVELDNLKPMFESGTFNIIKASFISLVYNVLPIFALLIVPKNNINNNKKLAKTFIISYSLVFLFMFIVIFYLITVLGVDLANLYQYPEYHILRLVNVANFFQRVESIISFIWILNSIMGISICLYFCKKATIQTIKNKKFNTLITIIISIIVILITKYAFSNNTVAENFFTNTYPFIITIMFFILPCILLVLLKFKKT